MTKAGMVLHLLESTSTLRDATETEIKRGFDWQLDYDKAEMTSDGKILIIGLWSSKSGENAVAVMPSDSKGYYAYIGSNGKTAYDRARKLLLDGGPIATLRQYGFVHMQL